MVVGGVGVGVWVCVCVGGGRGGEEMKQGVPTKFRGCRLDQPHISDDHHTSVVRCLYFYIIKHYMFLAGRILWGRLAVGRLVRSPTVLPCRQRERNVFLKGTGFL